MSWWVYAQPMTSYTTGAYTTYTTSPYGGATTVSMPNTGTTIGPSFTWDDKKLTAEAGIRHNIASEILTRCGNPKSDLGCWPNGECDHVEIAAMVMKTSIEDIRKNINSFIPYYGSVTVGATGTQGVQGTMGVTI